MPKSTKKNVNKGSKPSIVLSAIVSGFILVIPFFILEAFATLGFARSGFPLVLFISMWIIASIFVLLAIPFIKTKRKITEERPLFLVLRIALLVVLAWMWVGLIIDQWPCFLGASGC